MEKMMAAFNPDPEEQHRRAARRMNAVDELPADVRYLVHEYGLNLVKAFLDCGVRRPTHIRHLVETTLDEFSPTRGSYARQGIRTQVHIEPTPGIAKLIKDADG